jgi:hypothetical protein
VPSLPTLPLGMGVGMPVGAGVPASRGGVPGLGLEPGSVLCCDAAGSPARLKLESAGVCTECRRASPMKKTKTRARWVRTSLRQCFESPSCRTSHVTLSATA